MFRTFSMVVTIPVRKVTKDLIRSIKLSNKAGIRKETAKVPIFQQYGWPATSPRPPLTPALKEIIFIFWVI